MCVSRMRTTTMIPEASVSAAKTAMAARCPKACATMPESNAPKA